MALSDRMLRAVRAEESLYEEVEHDSAATVEALTIVVIVAVASGIGAALLPGQTGAALGLGGLVSGVIGALVGWALFAGITYLIGTRLYNAQATWEEVLRTLGYAQTPMIAQVVLFIPCLGALVAFAAAVWALYLTFIAIRAALDISSGATIVTILLSLIPTLVLRGLVMLPFTR